MIEQMLATVARIRSLYAHADAERLDNIAAKLEEAQSLIDDARQDLQVVFDVLIGVK